MKTIAVGTLLVFGLAYVAYAVTTMLQFYSYCEQVAKATGRVRDNANFWNRDEGGNNAFQREQLRRLTNGDFTEFQDPELVSRGRTLAVKLRLARWLAVALVLSVAAAVVGSQ